MDTDNQHNLEERIKVLLKDLVATRVVDKSWTSIVPDDETREMARAKIIEMGSAIVPLLKDRLQRGDYPSSYIRAIDIAELITAIDPSQHESLVPDVLRHYTCFENDPYGIFVRYDPYEIYGIPNVRERQSRFIGQYVERLAPQLFESALQLFRAAAEEPRFELAVRSFKLAAENYRMFCNIGIDFPYLVQKIEI